MPVRDSGIGRVGPACPARRDRLRAVRLGLCACVALLAAIVSLGLASLPGGSAGRPAHAASARPAALICSGACVGIITPVFNGVAEGPVGAHLMIEGANWPTNTTLTIWPALDQAACAQPPPPGITGSLAVDNSGNASGSYDWPLSVKTVGQAYLLCAVDGDTTITSGVQTSAPDTYTVLAADPPALTLSSPAITLGETLTVSGQNWLPRQQNVTVNICSDAACSAQPIASQSVTSDAHGAFTAPFPIPASIPIGAYYILAATANGALTAPPAGSQPQLMVNAPATATPTPSPTVTITPTTPPATSTVPPGGGKNQAPLLILVLGTLSLLFLIGGIISLAVYMRTAP